MAVVTAAVVLAAVATAVVIAAVATAVAAAAVAAVQWHGLVLEAVLPTITRVLSPDIRVHTGISGDHAVWASSWRWHITHPPTHLLMHSPAVRMQASVAWCPESSDSPPLDSGSASCPDKTTQHGSGSGGTSSNGLVARHQHMQRCVCWAVVRSIRSFSTVEAWQLRQERC